MRYEFECAAPTYHSRVCNCLRDNVIIHQDQSVPLEEKALRYNDDKLEISLVPPEWIEQLTKVLMKGAAKYSRDNWKKSQGASDHDTFRQKCIDAGLRHVLAYQRGEQFDPEQVNGTIHNDTRHLAHAAWNFLAAMSYDLVPLWKGEGK